MLKAIVGAALLVTAATGLAAKAPDYELIPGTFEKGRQPDGNSILLDAPGGLIVIDTGRHAAQQEKILAAAKGKQYGVRSIVHAIVQSELFRNK